MNLVVLSRNVKLYSTRRLVEAAQKRGHEIRVIDHSKCDLVIEKRKPKVLYRGEEITGVNAVIPRIGASVTFYGTAVVRQFEMMNVFTAVESQALVRATNCAACKSSRARAWDFRKQYLPTIQKMLNEH
jgi:ribosomal protein S6--L-glutamate ligase